MYRYRSNGASRSTGFGKGKFFTPLLGESLKRNQTAGNKVWNKTENQQSDVLKVVPSPKMVWREKPFRESSDTDFFLFVIDSGGWWDDRHHLLKDAAWRCWKVGSGKLMRKEKMDGKNTLVCRNMCFGLGNDV